MGVSGCNIATLETDKQAWEASPACFIRWTDEKQFRSGKVELLFAAIRFQKIGLQCLLLLLATMAVGFLLTTALPPGCTCFLYISCPQAEGEIPAFQLPVQVLIALFGSKLPTP